MSFKYPCTIRSLNSHEGGGYLAEAIDLNGCMADGETPEEALHNLEGAIEAWIITAKELKIPVPQSSTETSYSGKWVIRTPKSLHKKLSILAEREGVSLNSLTISLLSEGVGYKRL